MSQPKYSSRSFHIYAGIKSPCNCLEDSTITLIIYWLGSLVKCRSSEGLHTMIVLILFCIMICCRPVKNDVRRHRLYADCHPARCVGRPRVLRHAHQAPENKSPRHESVLDQ